jgi:protein ImuB
MILCLRADVWPAARREALLEKLLAAVPRLAVATDQVWVDARGLDAERLATWLCAIGIREGVALHAGIAVIPVAAEVAARLAAGTPQIVLPGQERDFLAARSLALLGADESLRLLLSGVGIETCGQLAALDREAIEVRFGSQLLTIWQQSRGDDARRLFAPVVPDPPNASIEFLDYVISDPERLIFSVNALFGGICDELRLRGQHARRVKLTFMLANREKWERVLRPARPSASRTVWLRLTRAVLERITIDDAVCAIALLVDGTEAASAVQGDLFDAGFATATAVDAVLDRLIEEQGEVMVSPEESLHPLVERRSAFVAERAASWASQRTAESDIAETQRKLRAVDENVTVRESVNGEGALTLQLLAQPREVLVETVRRRDHQVPIRYRDGLWKQLVTAAGPDRISGGRWDETYAREYFRAVTVDGVLVWLYRDARSDGWYLHGWWD